MSLVNFTFMCLKINEVAGHVHQQVLLKVGKLLTNRKVERGHSSSSDGHK